MLWARATAEKRSCTGGWRVPHLHGGMHVRPHAGRLAPGACTPQGACSAGALAATSTTDPLFLAVLPTLQPRPGRHAVPRGAVLLCAGTPEEAGGGGPGGAGDRSGEPAVRTLACLPNMCRPLLLPLSGLAPLLQLAAPCMPCSPCTLLGRCTSLDVITLCLPQVVTVPAHFNQAQQGATHAAAQQAGIATVQLLQVR